MRTREINRMFEIELGVFGQLEKITTEVAEYYVNSAMDRYWKTRVSGYNSTGDKIDDTDKRVADIAPFIKDAELTPLEDTGNVYHADLPDNFNMLLADNVGVVPLSDKAKYCWDVDATSGDYLPKIFDTQEGRINTINQLLRGSLSEYRLNNGQARPVRVLKGNTVEIHTDGEYAISVYNITYIAKPTKIDFIGVTKDAEYDFLPDSVIIEVVRLAAEMYKDKLASKRTESLRELNTIE
jgi:hypothetical protein